MSVDAVSMLGWWLAHRGLSIKKQFVREKTLFS